MKKKIFIVANWKMNLSIKDATKFITIINRAKYDNKITKVIICPQFLLIPKLSHLLQNNRVLLGAQDSHYNLSGAFTGDTSSDLLKYFNCEYVILGHSERRQYHNETYNIVKQKILTAVSVKIKPIICVGETLDERKKKNYKKVIEDQLEKCIPINLKEVIIAYEPIWSIGTGVIPKYSEIEVVSNIIYEFLKKRKLRPKILYGGSVNKKNFKNIISIKNICGGLIGGASLNPHELIEMIEKV